MQRSYFFVRHGRAVYQEPGFRFEDHPKGTDWPLCEVGHGQARAVAPMLLRYGVERVVSSELARARETAGRIAAHGLPFEHRWEALNELDPRRLRTGPWPFPEPPEWWSGYRMVRAMRRHTMGARTFGWDVSGVHERVHAVLGRLDALAERRVAVVGHGYWILLATVALRGALRPRWIDNCSITRVDADGRGRYRVVCFAQRAAPISVRTSLSPFARWGGESSPSDGAG